MFTDKDRHIPLKPRKYIKSQNIRIHMHKQIKEEKSNN